MPLSVKIDKTKKIASVTFTVDIDMANSLRTEKLPNGTVREVVSQIEQERHAVREAQTAFSACCRAHSLSDQDIADQKAKLTADLDATKALRPVVTVQ